MKLPFVASVVLVITIVTGLNAADRTPSIAGSVGRSVVIAPQGMVATSHPLAAQIGIDILKQGGNAVDAAIAVNAALGVLEPMSCGVGGDLFAIVWDAKTQRLYGLNASGRAPLKTSIKHYTDKGLTDMPESGPLSWSVPGCVDGWMELNKKFGSLPLAKILVSSAAYAENGAPVPEVIAGYWRASASGLRSGIGTTEVYLNGPNGRVPAVGDVFKNPALAKTYRLIGEGGADAYYRGSITDQIVAFSEKNGGLFTKDDFAKHTSTWIEPVKTTYRGHDIWELPPPGQGIAVLQMLNLLEPYNLKQLGPNSAEYWHTMIEAKKVAYADRAQFYADPDFAKMPIEELISKSYADERRKLIDPKKVIDNIPHGDPKLGKSDTVYLCVVDKDRNCVSLIQSNYNGFGSKCAVPELGFALQNRGCLFALDDKHPNRLEPGKRPFHTIIPAMVTKDGKPRFVFGVMGGDMQPQGQVQVLVNMLDHGMNVQAAGEAPRIEHIGSATPTGKEASGSGTVKAEVTLPKVIVEELRKLGHKVDLIPRNGGGYQGIWIDPVTGMLHGGSEARKDGMAIGY